MRFYPYLAICLLSSIITTGPSFAWGPEGHKTVGAIADQMIAGSHAADEVKKLLGNLSLQEASVWADCAKGIDPAKDYTYKNPGKYPECKIYETPEREAEMADFVRRNDTSCNPKPGEESCHKQYHYTDIAIQHNHFDSGYVGASKTDIVHAVSAATHVLQGDPSPAPFNIKDKREAPLLLAHHAGDIHQPMHVGAIYLDKNGKRVNPDKGTYDPTTSTRGGNKISVKGGNMHSKWDSIPASLKVSHGITDQLKLSEAVPVTKGQLTDWPENWAGDTIGHAKQAFKNVKFGNLKKGRWQATLPANYSSTMNKIKKEEMADGGARLAQLLKVIWP